MSTRSYSIRSYVTGVNFHVNKNISIFWRYIANFFESGRYIHVGVLEGFQVSIIQVTFDDKPVYFRRCALSRGKVEVKSFSTYDTSYEITRKNEQPEFQSKLNATTWMIFMDFDYLPNGFGDWDSFSEYLKSFNLGCVIRTRSEKAKVVLLVDSDAMSNKIAFNTFRKYFGELVDSCDMNAFMHSYIMPDQFELLTSYLNSSPLTQAVRDTDDWDMIEIPKFENLNALNSKVLQFFMSSRNEFVDGSQKYMAEIFNVSQSAISMSIKKLISLGYISLVDKSYQVGIKAKTYKVVNTKCIEFKKKKFLSKALLSYCNTKITSLPQSIEDGTWFGTVWASTRLFNNASQFLKWLTSLSGVMLKGRYRRSIRAWNAHASNNGLDLIPI